MTRIWLVISLLVLPAMSLAAPMTEMKGLRANQGCLEPSRAATGTLKTCPVDGVRIRIWCTNGKVFDRDAADAGVAVLRSICELNQLPG
jgi:hypothetical protein